MELGAVAEHGRSEQRLRCAAGHVHYDNPVPVVGCIVECPERGVLLVQNVGWPSTFFGLVTGFLERTDASPAQAMVRELLEEVNLQVAEEQLQLLECAPFARLNQVIILYHVLVAPSAVVTLAPAELAACKWVPLQQLRPWPQGTGPPLKRWLAKIMRSRM